MNYRRKVYMYQYQGYRDKWVMSKTYVSAYQCQKSADALIKKGIHVEFYEAELDWDWVDQVYYKNTITEG